MKILKNQNYTGDLMLQKTYVENHLTKKQKMNKGELNKYKKTDTAFINNVIKTIDHKDEQGNILTTFEFSERSGYIGIRDIATVDIFFKAKTTKQVFSSKQELQDLVNMINSRNERTSF